MSNTEQTNEVRAVRFSTKSTPIYEKCRVIVEQPITISIEGVGDYTLMCTPSDTIALAVGFALTEGLATSIADIESTRQRKSDPFTILMRLGNQAGECTERQRPSIVTSSYSIRGTEKTNKMIDTLPHLGCTLKLSLSTIFEVHKEMRARQKLFAETGGTHAAALFTADGEIVAFAEDIGRHNAIDKAVGKLFLTQSSSSPLQERNNPGPHYLCKNKEKATGLGLAFSGRISFEIVVKAARVGIELIAAVSAPSSLAIEAANRCGITLCGFVRDDRATVYCHDSRITS